MIRSIVRFMWNLFLLEAFLQENARLNRCEISQIPPDSYANAFTGCFHAGEGAGRACMDDLVVKT